MRAARTRRAIADLAAATPRDRDRYVDLLRAFSIFVVVLGHWLMAIVYFEDGKLTGANALDVIPGLWVLTWVLQVMPLFFFVGGFSNFVSWRSAKRTGTYGDFLTSRFVRMLRPTLAFVGVWTAAAIVLRFIDPDAFTSMGTAMALVAKPLWFLAVYVIVTALAPVMLGLHHRFRIQVLFALLAATAFADILRIGVGLEWVGYVNFMSVWLFAHQLGFFYADGSFGAKPRTYFVRIAAAGLACLVALVSTGIYSPSMVGMVTEKASNNSPPTICLVALTLWLVGAAMALKPTIDRWLQRPRVWQVVVAANSMIMTVFLWHLTAALIAAATLYPLGFPQPSGGSALWWAWRPVWVAALGVILVPLVVVFHRFENSSQASGRGDAGRRSHHMHRRASVGVAAVALGLSILAQFGFDMSGERTGPALPLIAAAALGFGYVLIVREAEGGAR